MKKLSSFLLIGSFAAFAVFTSSCKKEQGCTDSAAINYNADAEEDDGSCLYDACPSCVALPNEINSDMTLTADKIYRLSGRVYVNNGATLTIKPGTIIKADPGQGQASSALIIRRGGMINAAGKADSVIVFTSVQDNIKVGEKVGTNLENTQNGLWGGVIILGKALISAQNDNGVDITELQVEGIPTSEDAKYGGNDDGDNSGVFSYVSIRHGGTNIGAGNEINGLTLGGVGSGTTIDHIEVVANQDDGIEWFGGSVSLNNVLIWNSGDDGLDTDQDWIGSCTDFIIVTPRGGSAFELDGPEGTLNRGTHQFTNGIVYAGDDIDHLVDWDGSTNAGVADVYFYGIANDYKYIADDPNTPDDDEEFSPIESYGGDGTGNTTNWEYTAPASGTPEDQIFTGVPASPSAELNVVGANNNTVGPNSSTFGWTWASQSGALGQIGL